MKHIKKLVPSFVNAVAVCDLDKSASCLETELAVVKYQVIQREGPHVDRATHTRIGREVRIHRFAAGPSVEESDRVLRGANLLAKLDHPLIPHVIDLKLTNEQFHLVIESHCDSSPLSPAVDLLAFAHNLECITDALAHAHEGGVAHGELHPACFVTDSQRQLRIIGIGLRQLRDDTPLDQLIAEDHAALAEWIRVTAPSASSGPEQAEEVARQNRDLQFFADCLFRVSRGENTHAMRAVHRQVRSWLAGELAIRERRMLSVEETASDVRETSQVGWMSREYAIAACAGIGLIIVALSVFSVSYRTRTIGDARGGVTKSIRPLGESRPAPPADDREEILDLSRIGAVNSQHSLVPDSIQHRRDVQRTQSRVDELSVATIPSSDTFPEPVTSNPHDNEAGSDVAIVETTTPPTLRHLPKAIALPDSSDTTAVAILQPIEASGLEVELRGGEGAYRLGTFSIEPASADDSWSIVHRDKAEVRLATLVLSSTALYFQWSPSAAEYAAAKSLGNAVLHLQFGGSTATVALRTPHSIRALPAVLHEGIVRHKIPIEFPPSWADVFVEFVPSDDSLAVAMNTNVMPADEGQLWLGLEAGENSLFFMQVKSRMSKRRSLEFIPHSRLHVGDAPVEIKKGAIHQFGSEVMIARRAVLGGKSSIKRIKDRKQKAAAQARLRKLEANLKNLAEVAESYDAASMTKLHFRVFRRVEGRDVDLCQIGQGHRESDH